MLKRLALSELELGMFVHKMEGGWLDHPFWKSQFLIDDQERLNTLKSSRLRGVVIDTAKGKDVSAPVRQDHAQAPDAALPHARIKAIQKRSRIEEPSVMPVTLEQELHAAEAIAAKAKQNLNRALIAARLGKALNVRTIEPVVSDILSSVRRNPQAFSGLMRCKLRNELMFEHALSVSALMVSLGQKMKLPAKEVHECGLAGLLLDIGVNYLPEAHKPPNGDYRNADPNVWQQHVMLGYRALQNDSDLPLLVLDACLQHHERMDGSGFPKGLPGHQISMAAKMAAICDTFDFLLSKTNTAAALDPAAAIQHMRALDNKFDEDILRHFIESVGLYPVGSFVILRSEKVAMVIDEDHKEHTKPVVQAFYSIASGERIAPHRIHLARPDCNDAIVGIADLSTFGLPEDDQLREQVFLSTYKNAA